MLCRLVCFVYLIYLFYLHIYSLPYLVLYSYITIIANQLEINYLLQLLLSYYISPKSKAFTKKHAVL